MLQQIKQDLLSARKEKNKNLITILSTLLGEMQNKVLLQGEKAGIQVVKAFAKSAKENFDRTKSDTDKQELDVYLSYLPKEIELSQIIEDIKNLNLTTMPMAMKELRLKYKDAFNGKTVKEAFEVVNG